MSLGEHLRHGFGWVAGLEDTYPRRLSGSNPLDDGVSPAIPPMKGWGTCRGVAQGTVASIFSSGIWRAVISIVDEEHFCGDVGGSCFDSIEQGLDVLGVAV
jgi:hypothetical protein